MKKLKIIAILLIILIILGLAFYIFIKQLENGNMTATKKAVIVKLNDNNMLAMGIENGNALYTIGFKDEENIGFKEGQEISIYYDGYILETYPEQFGNIKEIKILNEKSNVEIPDEIVRYCYSTRDKVDITVNEITNESLQITIIDSNDLPYNYSNNYIINKKVKNENYTGIGYKIGEDTKNSTSGYTRYRCRICMERSR